MNKIKNLLLGVLFVLFVFIAGFLGFSLSYRGLILPNVFVSDVDLGGLDSFVAEKKIKMEFDNKPNTIVFLKSDGTDLGKVGKFEVERNFKWVSDQAIKIGRTGNLLVDIKTRIDLIYKPMRLEIPLIFDENEMDNYLEALIQEVQVEPKWPIIAKKDKSFQIIEGNSGLVLNKEKIKAEVRQKLGLTGRQQLVLETEVVDTSINKEAATRAMEFLNSWGDQTLLIKYREYNKKLTVEEIAPLFGLTGNVLNSDNFQILVRELSEKIETDPKDAVFEFENGRVKEFKAEVIGVTMDKPKFEKILSEALTDGKTKSIDIPVILEYPKVLAGDVNNMGIKELIGVGKSSFSHSIPNRVFNVNLAASRINGVVIAPGEEFSFVKAVGDINRQTGYQAAYVISEGKTVLGDGGGVCQVSTTVFRAAMNFGFPITERKAHAYRVGYYEQDSSPGLDATVYAPTTDLKFLNDTGHHILIQAKVDTKNLTMKVEIYGTNDGRVSSISKPVVSGQVGAPPTSYIDDPNLPKGTTKQIDFAAAGARVAFDYKVERGGESLFEKRFVSSYQPWRAVYLVGTGQ